MSDSGQRAIVRFVPRAKGAVQLGLLSPCLALDKSSSQPDCLWMNMLPFAEDIRSATFMPFDQPKRVPDKQQLRAMQTLVQSMDLTAGECVYIELAASISAASLDRKIMFIIM